MGLAEGVNDWIGVPILMKDPWRGGPDGIGSAVSGKRSVCFWSPQSRWTSMLTLGCPNDDRAQSSCTSGGPREPRPTRREGRVGDAPYPSYVPVIPTTPSWVFDLGLVARFYPCLSAGGLVGATGWRRSTWE